MMAEIGQILNGRYNLIKALGVGGMGLTYIAEDMKLPEHPKCAIKHLRPPNNDPNTLSTFRTLFKREIDALRQLSDRDKIPQLIDDFEEAGEFYLVREYIEGHPLKMEMSLGIRWTEPQVIEMLKEVLSILNFVHSQGVIHRDIKPDNIIRRQADGKLILIDFGAVKRLSIHSGGSPLVSATNVVGTFGYMAAEQGQGRPKLNSDLYSLGIVGIQALTGMLSTQFQEDDRTGELIWQHVISVSPGLAAVLSKMVKAHFRDRYQSAAEVLRDLATISPVLVSTIATNASETYVTPNSIPSNLRIQAAQNSPQPKPDFSSHPTVIGLQLSEAITNHYNSKANPPAREHSESTILASTPPEANQLNQPLGGQNSPPVPPIQPLASPSQPDRPSTPSKPSRLSGIRVAAIAVGICTIAAVGTILGLRAGGVILPANPFNPIVKLSDAGGDKKLTVGVITNRSVTKENYNSLLAFLKTELGSDVSYEIEAVAIRDGQKAIDRVKQKMANKEWDVAFTRLPNLSVAAKDNGYVYAARMSPERKEGDSVFFVRADSHITKFDDIVDNPSLKIALGNFDSAQAFYVPLFHLYGTALQASYDNSQNDIFDKVKSDKADVGVGSSNAVLRRNSSKPTPEETKGDEDSGQQANQNNEDAPTSPSFASISNNSPNSAPGERKAVFRVIKPRNEDIPVPRSGVYISPQVSQAERDAIVKTLLKAPAPIQKQASYGKGEEPDYTLFRKVSGRVNEILKCADYRSAQQVDSNQFYAARFYKRNGCS
jgi:serine/threonine protein kinase/ABC-type phosphate/phosphonate transport system substrate-binding protein